MLSPLDRDAEQQVATARKVLAELRDALVRFGASAPDRDILARSIEQLDAFFLLVVVGEFNAGKSAFINALIGETVLREGVTPTTARIQLVKHGEQRAEQPGPDGILVITSPAQFLRDVHIVDTPGTNAIIRQHEQLTTEFVPRADLVLFITSADRPFSESERQFLEVIRGWGKKVVFILNKVDTLGGERDVDEVVQFITDAARRLLGIAPDVLPVSARLAARAKHGEPALWAASRFEGLESYLRESLDDRSRFKLKMSNPLGVAIALADKYRTIAGERLSLLEHDAVLLQEIDGQLTVFRDDLARGFDLRMDAIEKVLVEMEARGHQYFEDTLRIGRVMDLLNRARVQKEFEDRVVADAPRRIEQRVTDLVDWMIDQDFRQWQTITARLGDRLEQHGANASGSPEIGTFHADRGRLIDSVGREAQRVVDTYDRRREAEAIADQARVAVTTAAAVGAGAVGLGTIVTIAATTAAADVTGLLMASVVAALGFLVIPERRRRARAEMREKVSTLRAKLATALRAEFERAQTRSRERVEGAVAPYSRFVRAEQTRSRDAHDTLKRLRDLAADLQNDIEAGRPQSDETRATGRENAPRSA